MQGSNVNKKYKNLSKTCFRPAMVKPKYKFKFMLKKCFPPFPRFPPEIWLLIKEFRFADHESLAKCYLHKQFVEYLQSKFGVLESMSYTFIRPVNWNSIDYIYIPTNQHVSNWISLNYTWCLENLDNLFGSHVKRNSKSTLRLYSDGFMGRRRLSVIGTLEL